MENKLISFGDKAIDFTYQTPYGKTSTLEEKVQKADKTFLIFLRYYEGYSVKEIALLLGKSPALVSTHLKRAREKLKTMLGGMADEL